MGWDSVDEDEVEAISERMTRGRRRVLLDPTYINRNQTKHEQATHAAEWGGLFGHLSKTC